MAIDYYVLCFCLTSWGNDSKLQPIKAFGER